MSVCPAVADQRRAPAEHGLASTLQQSGPESLLVAGGYNPGHEGLSGQALPVAQAYRRTAARRSDAGICQAAMTPC